MTGRDLNLTRDVDVLILKITMSLRFFLSIGSSTSFSSLSSGEEGDSDGRETFGVPTLESDEEAIGQATLTFVIM